MENSCDVNDVCALRFPRIMPTMFLTLLFDVHDLIVFVKKRRVVFVSPFCIGLLASAAAGALLEKLKNT